MCNEAGKQMIELVTMQREMFRTFDMQKEFAVTDDLWNQVTMWSQKLRLINKEKTDETPF